METTKEFSSHQVSEIQLSYKTNVKASERPKITSSREAYAILLSNWDDSKIEFVEQFKAVLLNRANKVLGIVEISSGGVSGTVADPKLIFAAALKANATSVLIAHNHPSSNTNPSQQDILLTQRMKEVGRLLDLPIIDHLIITPESYYSFADEGLL